MAGRGTDYSIKMSADIGDLEQKLSKARQSIENFGSNAQVAAKGMRDLFNVRGLDQLASQFSGVEQVVNKLGTTFAKTGGSTRQQLKVLQQAATDLTITYRNLSEAEQQSAQGQALAQYINRLVGKAGELKDAMMDVGQEIKNMASDTRQLDVLAQGMQVMASSVQVAAGALTVFGVEESKVAQIQQRLTSIIAVTNGLTQIQNALQKESALMQALRSLRMKIATAIENANTKAIQTNTVAERVSMATTQQDTAAKAANTVAEVANGAATKAGTAIQQAWNVAKAVAKALLGDFTGLLLVGAGALATYAIATAGSTDEIEEQSKALKDNNGIADANLVLKERLRKSEQEWSKEVTQNASNQIAQYVKLQLKWQECNTSQKLREKFQKEYGDEVNRVAGRLMKLSEYEDFFVRDTDKVVNAILARAAAEAGAQKYAEAVLKKAENDRNGTLANGRYRYAANAGDKIYLGDRRYNEIRAAKEAGVLNGDDVAFVNTQLSAYYKLTEEGARKMNKLWRERAQAVSEAEQAEIDYWHDWSVQQQKAAAVAEKAAGMGSGYNPPGVSGGRGGTTGGGSSAAEQAKPLAQSLEWLREQLRKLQQDLSYGLIPADKVDETKAKIDHLKEDIEKKEIELGFKAAPTTDYEARIGGYNKWLRDLEVSHQKYVRQKEEINRQFLEDDEKLAQQLRDGLITQEEYTRKSDKLWEEHTDKVGNIEGLLVYDKPPTSLDNIAKHYQDMIAGIDKQLSENDLTVEARVELHGTRAQYQRKLDEIVRGELTIKADIQPTFIEKGSADDMRQSYQNQLQKAQKLQHDYEIGLIDYPTFKSTLEQMNEDLENFHLKPIILEVKNPLHEQIDLAADAINTLGSSLTQLGQATDDKSLNALGILAEAIANIWLAYSKASAQAASMGPWAWVGFSLGALGQTVGIINAMKQNKFAGGGMVAGNRLWGDMQVARVNAGEMILNGSQQKRLFNLLDGGYANFRGTNGSGEVTFKVKGRDLIAVMNNQNDKMGKIK